MQSNKVELEKREFLIGEPSIENFQLTCWQRRQENYSIHIFSTVYESGEQMLANYPNVRDYIAMYFQSETLELDIERWNMYEFVFLKEKLAEVQKQTIEQDKFATRKLVFDEISKDINEEYIKETIIEELFTFDIEKRDIVQENIYNYLQDEHKEIINFINTNHTEDNATLLNELINSLGDAEN